MIKTTSNAKVTRQKQSPGSVLGFTRHPVICTNDVEAPAGGSVVPAAVRQSSRAPITHEMQDVAAWLTKYGLMPRCWGRRELWQGRRVCAVETIYPIVVISRLNRGSMYRTPYTLPHLPDSIQANTFTILVVIPNNNPLPVRQELPPLLRPHNLQPPTNTHPPIPHALPNNLHTLLFQSISLPLFPLDLISRPIRHHSGNAIPFLVLIQ